MDGRVDWVVAAALRLPPLSRARLADSLLASLDGLARKEVERMWAKEAEDRVSALEKGVMKAIPGDDVLGELRSRKREWNWLVN